MGLELAIRFNKAVLKDDVEQTLATIEGLIINGERGYRWENEELEGFFTVDLVEPAKQKKKKPKLEGVDINVPWGGPTEEIAVVEQIVQALAALEDISVESPQIGEVEYGSYGQIDSLWHGANVQALVGFANQDGLNIRHLQSGADSSDHSRVEMLDATRLSVDRDQQRVYQINCGMRVAQAFQRCGEHKLAIVAAHRVIEEMPDESFAHILLGISFSALGDRDTAVKTYQRAIHVNPDGDNVEYAQAMIESLGGA